MNTDEIPWAKDVIANMAKDAESEGAVGFIIITVKDDGDGEFRLSYATIAVDEASHEAISGCATMILDERAEPVVAQ